MLAAKRRIGTKEMGHEGASNLPILRLSYCEEDFMPERLVDVEKKGAKILTHFLSRSALPL